jgi:signal transduction histidine kinase
MANEALNKLAALIRQEREAILAQWRREVKHLPVAQNLDTPTLNDHVPDLLDELAAALLTESPESMVEAQLEGSPKIHGLERLRAGFDIVEVVAEYNVLRNALQDLVETHGIVLQGAAGRIVNRVIDEAIGLAVNTYATQKAVELQQRREEHLSFVAHDLRTPLVAISIAASILGRNISEGDAESSMMLDTLHRNVKRLDGLVTKVVQEEVNLSTNTALKIERREFDLWPLIHGLIYDLQPLAEASGTELRNRVSIHQMVYGDAGLLTQVFQNLISNAIDYTPNGEVLIGAQDDSEAGGAGASVCWVSDDGAGIPPDQQERVFEKLFTDPEKKGGMGLGLAIVKQIVEAHGGEITLESREGQGSTFRFTLPGPTT